MNETVKVALIQYAARHSHMSEDRQMADAALSQLEAETKTLADVRTLDGWAASHPGMMWTVKQHPAPLRAWCCQLHSLCWFSRDTPDEARAAAALRQRLGLAEPREVSFVLAKGAA